MTNKTLALSAGLVLMMSVVPAMAGDLPIDEARLQRVPGADGPMASSLQAVAALPAGLREDSGAVDIEIYAEGVESDMVADLEGLGATVDAQRDDVYLVRAPIRSLDAIARLDAVGYLGPQPTPHPLGDTSEGVATMKTPTWTGDGATGKGQRVAIIDVGFAGYDDAVDSGDLPDDVMTKNYCGNFQGSVHGTGVAEIVHDVAPEADLYLICIENTADLDHAVDYAINHGIDVINHSVGWWNTSRGDGSGHPLSPEGIAGRAVDSGIVWIQAAGNHADRHWKGKFFPNVDWWHEFAVGDDLNHLSLYPGETVVVYLKWDRWPTTSYDYNLYLTDSSGGTALAWSVTAQDGDDPPTEQLSYTNNTGSMADVAIKIDGLNTQGKTGKPRLDLFILTDVLEHHVKASSLVEPAGHPDVVTVGATCWSDDDLASYSSRGPTIAGLSKPNLTAPTGVSTSAYGGGNSSCATGFTGTSSAAPHAAGMAALILDTNGSLSPKKVMDRMEAHVVDLGPDGNDNRFGAGRVNAYGLCRGEVPNIVGTSGKDDLVGTPKNDVIHAYGGDDTANGKAGSDLICGGPGDDHLRGAKGNDDLFGQNGDDVIVGGIGADLLNGGDGLNTADYSSADDSVTVNLLKGLAKGGAGKDTLRKVTAVIGSDFADTLRGDSSGNILDGGKRADYLQGRGGGDTLLGKRGDDSLEGGSGDDLLKGGSGDDHMVGGAGVDTGVGGAGDDTCETIENLTECE